MNINNHKFEKRNDKAVFKALIRCYKDDGKLCDFYRNKRGIQYIINHCYSSRHRHIDEPYQINIHYWPGDIPGGSFKHSITNFLYAVRLVNAMKAKITANLKEYLQEEGNIILNKYNDTGKRKAFMEMPSFYAFYDEICNAYIKCGYGEAVAEQKAKTICNISHCIKENIPI